MSFMRSAFTLLLPVCANFCLPLKLHAALWGILPVLVHTDIPSSKKGPAILPNPKSLALDLQLTVSLYLRAGGLDRQYSPLKIQKIFRGLKLAPHRPASEEALATIASRGEADNYLQLSVRRTTSGFQWESRVFYAASKLLTDPILSRDSSFWRGLGRHLEKRFPDYIPSVRERKQTFRPAIFLLDGSAANEPVLNALKKEIARLDIRQSGGCAATGDSNRLIRAPIQEHPRGIKHLLHRIRPSGAFIRPASFSQLVECARKLSPYKGNTEDLPYVFFFVSSAPQDSGERLRLKAAYRKLASSAEVYLFGAPIMSDVDRSFWEDVSQEQRRTGRSVFISIMRRQKVFFADGESLYLFRKGNTIIESHKTYPSENARGLTIPQEESSSTIAQAYRAITGKVLKTQGKKDLVLTEEFHKIFTDRIEKQGPGKSARILIEADRIPVWVNFPVNELVTRKNKMKLRAGDSAYLMINVETPTGSEPFRNTPGFGKLILNGSYVPRSLLLPVEPFFKEPEKFVRHSIGDSSIYVIFGKVKIIRLNAK